MISARLVYPIFGPKEDAVAFISGLTDEHLRQWDYALVSIIYNHHEQDRWKKRVQVGNRLRWEPSRQSMITNCWSSRHLIFEELKRRGLEDGRDKAEAG